jgi:hypothetical protein
MPKPSDDEIAKRAYELYLQRGSLPGYEIDDWLQAEAELAASASRTDPVSDEDRASDGKREPASGRRSGGRRDGTSSSSRRSLRE